MSHLNEFHLQSGVVPLDGTTLPPGEKMDGPCLRPQAVAALSSSSWRRAPAIIDARSDVSMTISKPRFTAPAANAALAQCMTALIPYLCAASRIVSQVAI